MLFCAAVESAPADTVYNAVTGFSTTNNPNGVWTYGQRPLGYGTFSIYATKGSASSVNWWAGSGTSWVAGLPGVFYNGTGADIPYWSVTVYMPSNMLDLHPGPAGQYSIVRFTAPAAGTYVVSAVFKALARDGGTAPGYSTTTDCHIYKNGVELYGANFNKTLLSTQSTGSLTTTLAVNDIVEVAVGRGSNGTYYSDSTGVDFTVTLKTTKTIVRWNQVALHSGVRTWLNRVIAKVGPELLRWSPYRRAGCTAWLWAGYPVEQQARHHRTLPDASPGDGRQECCRAGDGDAST
jgi:hypothetical protein